MLKHYLKMGGKILGFNRDPHFNNALDVFIVVDLLNSPKKLLELYMGKDGAADFSAYHQSPRPLEATPPIVGNTWPQLTWNS